MFYPEEDPNIYLNIKVYDNLDSYLDEMGDNIFSLKEKAIIKEATSYLNLALREVKDQIIGFCFC